MIQRHWLWRSLLVLILAGVFAAGAAVFEHAPKFRRLVRLTVEPSASDIVVGRQELGQKKGPHAAASRHIRLVREDGVWKMADAATDRNVDIRFENGDSRRLRRWQLRKGDCISVGPARLDVLEAGPSRFALRSREKPSGTATWSGGILRHEDEASVYDDYFTLKQRVGSAVRDLLRRAGLGADKEDFLFRLGGSVNGPDRLGLTGVAPGAAAVYSRGGAFFLGPGRGTATRIEMARKGGETFRFETLFVRIGSSSRQKGESSRPDAVSSFVAGRTYYKFDTTNDGTLVVSPERNIDKWFEDETPPEAREAGAKTLFVKEAVSFGGGESLWEWAAGDGMPGAILALLAALAAGAAIEIHRARLGRREKPALVFGLLAAIPAAAAIALLPFLWNDRPDLRLSDLAILAWLGWTWAAAFSIVKGRSELPAVRLTCAACFLAGFGAVALLQLAAGADNTRWADPVRKHLLILAPAGFSLAAWLSLSPEFARKLWKTFALEHATVFRGLRAGIAATGTALVFAQWFFGGEQGLGMLQPAEFAKLLLAAVAAFVGMDLAELWRIDPNPNRRRKTNRPAAWGFLKTLFVVGLGIVTALAGVRDISPILIMSIFFLAWLWAVASPGNVRVRTSTGTRGRSAVASPGNARVRTSAGTWIRSAVVAVVCVGIAAAFFLHDRPEILPNDFPQRDRFQVWAKPDLYPYSGEQSAKALLLAGLGGWQGATGSAFGQNGPAMELPMVRNDFIASFVLYKFGGAAGLALVLAQALYVLALFDAGRRASGWSGHFEDRQAGRILRLALLGLAWMHAAHFAVSWSNALGLLPVMGQPMPWISSANSHILLFALPTLFWALIPREEVRNRS